MLGDEPSTPSYDKLINDLLVDMRITNHLSKGKHIPAPILALSSILYEAGLENVMRKCMAQMFYAMIVYTPFNAPWARDHSNPNLMMDAFRHLRQKSAKNFITVMLTALPASFYGLQALNTVVTRKIVFYNKKNQIINLIKKLYSL